MKPTIFTSRGQWAVLAAGFLFAGALLIVPTVFAQERLKNDARAALRKDPKYPQIYHDGKAFFAFPPAKQDAMRKLNDDLEKLPTAERERLKEVLKTYADWMDRLPPADRRAVHDAPNNQARLELVKELREREWVARQPKAVRQFLDSLPAVAAASGVAILAAGPRGLRPLNAAV